MVSKMEREDCSFEITGDEEIELHKLICRTHKDPHLHLVLITLKSNVRNHSLTVFNQ